MTYLNPDHISDNLTLQQILDEKVIDQYDDIHFNSIRGLEHFTSRVVTDGPTADKASYTGKHFFCKARPINTMHDYCTPDPCSDTGFDPDQTKMLISMQPTMVSKKIIGSHDRPPKFNDSIKMSFYGEGPNASTARMRDPRYEHKSKKDRFAFKCSEKQVKKYAPSGGISGGKKLLGAPHPTGSIENVWGFKPTKATYHGAYLAKGTTVFNGYPASGTLVLGQPDPQYFTQEGGGPDMLKDFLESFNALAEAFYKKFNKKLKAGLSRDFHEQIKVRMDYYKKGNCKEMTSKYGTIGPSGKACPTAIPGTSHHGWGAAMDIRKDKRWLAKTDPEFTWLIDNAQNIGFKGIKWTWLGSALKPASLHESWHWEPIPSDIKKVLRIK